MNRLSGFFSAASFHECTQMFVEIRRHKKEKGVKKR